MSTQDVEDGELRCRDGIDGKVYVYYKGLQSEEAMPRIYAALLATKRVLTGESVERDNPELRAEAAQAGLAYQKVLTELACWELVKKGELMLRLTPGWIAGDTHRQVQFMTIDKKPVVIDTDLH